MINVSEITHKKFAIIIANPQGEYLPAVLINSKINKNIYRTDDLQSLHLKIDKKNHPFLDYDSFVNCSEIKELIKEDVIVAIEKNPNIVLGTVSASLSQQIQHKITNATTIEKSIKRKYGFL